MIELLLNIEPPRLSIALSRIILLYSEMYHIFTHSEYVFVFLSLTKNMLTNLMLFHQCPRISHVKMHSDKSLG